MTFSPGRLRIAFLLCLLVSLPLLVSCHQVAATNPYYTEADVIYDPELKGNWILYGDNRPFELDDSPIRLVFQEVEGQDYYKLRINTMGVGNEMKAVLFRFQSARFLDITPLEPEGQDRVFLPNVLHTHMVFRVKRDGEILWAAPFDENWAVGLVTHDLRGIAEFWQRPVLEFSTKDLQWFLAKAMRENDAFTVELRFSREHSESCARDMLDYGFRMLAYHGTLRGDCKAAKEEFQRAVEARRDNADTYQFLAFAQARCADEEAARNSISEWAKQCRQILVKGFGSGYCREGFSGRSPEEKREEIDIEEHALRGSSYFAEERWHEADHEFELVMRTAKDMASKFEEDTSPVQLENKTIDDAILLRSLALAHLGRETEAAGLLQPFHKSSREETRMIASYLLGEVDDAELLAKKRAAQMRTKTSESVLGYQSYVFMGCRHFLEGERGEAYERFERAFEMETPDELL